MAAADHDGIILYHATDTGNPYGGITTLMDLLEVEARLAAEREALIAALAAIPLLWLVRWIGTGSPVRATPRRQPRSVSIANITWSVPSTLVTRGS